MELSLRASGIEASTLTLALDSSPTFKRSLHSTMGEDRLAPPVADIRRGHVVEPLVIPPMSVEALNAAVVARRRPGLV